MPLDRGISSFLKTFPEAEIFVLKDFSLQLPALKGVAPKVITNLFSERAGATVMLNKTWLR